MNRKNQVRKCFAAACVLAVLAMTVYAIFFRTVAAKAQLVFSTNQFSTSCTLSAVTDSAAVTGTDALLKKPGDRVKFTIETQNAADGVPLSYGLRVQGSGDLAPCILATMDGVFLGSLQESEGVYTLPDTYYLAPGQSGTHELELELHIGAGRYLSGAKSCQVTVFAQAQTLDLNQVTFVNSAKELEQLCTLASTGQLPQTTGVLGKNIALEDRALTLKATTKDLILELNGYQLDLGAGGLRVTDGMLYLRDNRGKNQLVGGTLSVDGAGALIAGEALDGFTGTFSAPQYDGARLLHNYVIPAVTQRARAGLQSGESAALLGGYRLYQLAAAGENLTYAANTGRVTADATERSRNGMLTFAPDAVAVIPVIGSGAEAQIAFIEQQYLSFLKPAAGEDMAFVSYDLYLPGSFKELSCTVEWWSSNPDAITALGTYTPDLEQQSADLVATYRINGKQYVRTYPLRIRGQSHEERLSYLIAYYNAIFLEKTGADGAQELLTTENYAEKCGKNLNISGITYEVPQDYQDFLTVGTVSLAGQTSFLGLYLTRSTYFTTATLNITATFSDENADGSNSASGTIPVFILLEDRVTTEEIQAQVTQAAKTLFYDVMTDKTEPRLFIDLPMQYQENLISYYIPNTQSGTADGGTTLTGLPQDAADPYGAVNGKTVISGQGTNYTVTSEGDLDLAPFYGSPSVKEIVNGQNAYQAVSGSVVTKLETVSVVDPETGNVVEQEEQVPYFRITLDPGYLLAQEQKIYLVAYLKVDAASGDTGNRCAISIQIPAALRAAEGMFPKQTAFERAYTAVNDLTDQTLGCAQPTFILMKKLQSAGVTTLDFSGIGGLAESDLAGLKYFTGITQLDLSAPQGNGNSLQELMDIVARFTDMTSLKLQNCGITSLIPLETLTQLQVLDVSGNGSLRDITSIAAYAGALEHLNITGTAVDLTYNEWALAYCYYRRLDATSGKTALTVISDSTPGGNYGPAYGGLSNTDKYAYKVLVYKLARMGEIREVTTRYIWLPKNFIEADVGSYQWISPDTSKMVIGATTQQAIDKYKKNNGGVSYTSIDGIYQYEIQDGVSSGQTVLGALAVTNGTTDESGVYTPTVTCTRYFFIDYIDPTQK